jgi:hypothetical protein
MSTFPSQVGSWGRIHNISVSSGLTNGPNKLEHDIILAWKGFTVTNTLDNWGHL